MPNQVKQQIGPYKITGYLGSGGYGEVYLGVDEQLEREVAIKLLRASKADEKGREQFLLEAKLTARLSHPNIVQIYHVLEEQGETYIVMERLSYNFESLYPLGRVLPPKQVLFYLKQIGDALDHAHEQRVLHLDVKPSNLLLGRNQQVVVVDFGVAHLLPQAESHLSLAEPAGTLKYAAPELLDHHPRPASDQYSLGVLVYEWLTGVAPFRGTFSEVVMQKQYPPPSLRKAKPNLPDALETVLAQALDVDHEKRFMYLRMFVKAFERAIAGYTELPEPEPSGWLDASTLIDKKSLPEWLQDEEIVTVPRMAVAPPQPPLLRGSELIDAKSIPQWLRGFPEN